MFQCVTVKAPRRIIDVGVSLSHESPAPPVHEDSPAPGALVVGQQHQVRVTTRDEVPGFSTLCFPAQVPTRLYKQVLIQIERLYTLLLEAEDDEKMLSALPTGAPLREQVRNTFNSIPTAMPCHFLCAAAISHCV